MTMSTRNVFRLVAFATVSFALTACGDLPAEGEPCDESGDTDCDGRQVLECATNADGELEWREIAMCAEGQSCRISGSSYECRN